VRTRARKRDHPPYRGPKTGPPTLPCVGWVAPFLPPCGVGGPVSAAPFLPPSKACFAGSRPTVEGSGEPVGREQPAPGQGLTPPLTVALNRIPRAAKSSMAPRAAKSSMAPRTRFHGPASAYAVSRLAWNGRGNRLACGHTAKVWSRVGTRQTASPAQSNARGSRP
jgi:hypothetical protein